jgi:hypothetical protein
MTKVHYFGNIKAGQADGHQLYCNTGDGSKLRGVQPWQPYYILDSRLAPRLSNGQEAPQGQALIHHKDGWTAIAFFDRTGDPRGASNSVFLIEATVNFEEGVELARASWPQLFERFKKAGLELKEYEKE